MMTTPPKPLSATLVSGPNPRTLRDAVLDMIPEVAPGTAVIAVSTELEVLFAGGVTVLRRHGHDPEQIVGRHLQDVLPAEHYRRVLPLYREALAGRRSESDVPSADHAALYHVRAGPIRNCEHVVAALTVSQDVTQERRAEQMTEDLRVAEERFHRAFADAPIGMALVGLDGRFLQVNPAMCRITARGAEELLRLDFQAITHPDDLAADLRLVDELLAGRRDRYQMDKRYLRPDGSEVQASLHVSLARAADGSPAHFISQVVDIGPRLQLQDALRVAERRWHDVFDHGPVGMALVELGGSEPLVRSANRALARLLGTDAQDLEQRPLPALAASGADRHELYRTFAELRRDPTAVYRAELRLRGTKEPIPVEITVTATSSPGERALAIVHVHDVSERRAYEARLAYAADHDPLTGLFNRRRFEEELARAVAMAHRHQRPAALLLLDLDQFKYVNDAHGHLSGDEVIATIAIRLRRRLRDTDVLARIGGDEFGVILVEADAARAEGIAQELLESLRQTPVTAQAGHTTASIGIAPITPAWPLSAGELLMEADIAMYRAKEAGRNQVCVAGRERHEHEEMKAGRTWVDRIRRALDDHRFVLYAQPIVRTSDGTIDRYELLIRMHDDDGRIVGPGSFLPVAEHFGLIQDIDRWVAREAIATLAAHPTLNLAINLSGASIGDRRTVDELAAMLTAEGIDPHRFSVEVTETIAITSLDVARTFARSLTDLGCRLALDDFGAGFGSFAYLKHLPFTCLKIDGEFIRGIAAGRADRLTVEAIVQIARGLGKQTTAEYVGDRQTLDIARAIGVDLAQGYFIGRPVPLAEVIPRSDGAPG